jgi:hypothetical protein
MTNAVISIFFRYRSAEAKKKLSEDPLYSKKPTFLEFAHHVIDEARLLRFDMHWEPYHRFCTPCQVAFNAVVKFETLERDLNFIFEKANVLDVVDSGRRENRGSGETRSYVGEYFSQLPGPVFDRLVSIYAADFEMFGYSPQPYKKYLLQHPRQR